MIVSKSILSKVSEPISKAILDISLSVKSDIRLLHANLSDDTLAEVLLHGSDISKVNSKRRELKLAPLMQHLNVPTISADWDKLTGRDAVVFCLSNNFSHKKADDLQLDTIERVVKTFKGLSLDVLNNDKYTTIYLYKGSKKKTAAPAEDVTVEDKKPAKKPKAKKAKKAKAKK